MENFLRLKRMDNSLMLDIIGSKINTIEFDIHLKSIKRLKNFRKIYVNLANLSEISNDTINKLRKMSIILKDKNICLINVNPIKNAVLNLFNIDKIFQIYMTKRDAFEAKKPIINRKFKVLQ